SYTASRAQAQLLLANDGVVRAGLWIGQGGWRHKAYTGAHRAIAYPPKHMQIDSSTLYARKIAVFGGLAISMFRQGEIL
ncbi:MAG: hypothetical protein ABFD05_00495, partial [Anaerolineaceae bacterium]